MNEAEQLGYLYSLILPLHDTWNHLIISERCCTLFFLLSFYIGDNYVYC